MTAVSIHWFRKGLRLHDNPALLEACQGAQQVYPLFILDPHFANPEMVGVNRYRFLLQSLEDLDQSLKSLGSRLYVVQGNPIEELPRLQSSWNVTKLTFESDTEPYAKKRDKQVCEILRKAGVEVQSFPTHTLHDPERYMAKCGSKVPISYQSFVGLFNKIGKPAEAIAAPPSIPSSSPAAPPNELTVPSLAEMGYPQPSTPSPHPGGETEALARMHRHLARKQWIATFEKPKTSPNSLEPSTTVLSPYLKFGCLSPRLFYHELHKVYASFKSHSQPPVSLVGQLLWREFFYLCGWGIKNFDRMEGNPICKQIPWGKDEELLLAWKEGRTGYPFIDAIMTQLREEGWIHHLARHATQLPYERRQDHNKKRGLVSCQVACFLTRGDLWQHWEEGVKVFDLYLLDADWSLNNGNWLWLSASAFFYQFFRVYSPVGFGAKTDKDGAYIKKYLPQLRKFPTKYIYEPWKAPTSVQEAAGCIIGKDYPKPIVDHADISKVNMGKMKAAYDANKAQGGGLAPQGTEEGDDDDDVRGGGGGKGAASSSSSSSPGLSKKRAKEERDSPTKGDKKGKISKKPK